MNKLLILIGGTTLGFIIAYYWQDRNQSIHSKLNIIMATLADFQASFAEINEATTNIAADITRLTEQLGSNLSASEEEAALNELKGIATKLKDIAAVTPDGTPTPEPTP